MKKLVVIGEALIDFIPQSKNMALKDVSEFKKVAGGAPSNVASTFSKLGGDSIVLSQVGKDSFGDYIIDTLKNVGVNTNYILQSEEFDTSLAFVSLKDDGNRDFKFYRKTAADLQYKPEYIPNNILNNVGFIHFCSVDLVESPMKEAHKKLISLSKDNNVLVSFDPNLRFPLWDDLSSLKNTVLEFIKYADIIKISDEELHFITNEYDIEKAKDIILNENCKIFIYTMGKNGARLFTKNYDIYSKGLNVNAVDTTGAGDSFIGAFLYKLLSSGKDINNLNKEELKDFLDFANFYASLTTQKQGAIDSMPYLNDLIKYKK